MATAYPEYEVDSVSAFAELFEPGGVFHGSELAWFRGEDALFKRSALLPSIARPPSHVAQEWEIYQRFRQNAAAFLPHVNLEPWDWMLYMRHYGLHTRLLDWSESAMVALYFAVHNPKRDRAKGVVWCLNPQRLNELAGYGKSVQCAGVDTPLNNYTVEAVKNAAAGASYQPVAVIAARSFPRLIAQQGVFTVTHVHQRALDTIPETGLLARILIPGPAKSGIRGVLRTLGMRRLSLYPELQSLAAED